METAVLIALGIGLGLSLIANLALVCRSIAAKRRKTVQPEDCSMNILPFRLGLGLRERMADLGLVFRRVESTDFLPEDVKRNFTEKHWRDPTCRRCGGDVEELLAKNPAINPCKLGCFCTSCGEGCLFTSIKRVREAGGLLPLPDGNLFAILNVLEHEALSKGIIKSPRRENTSSEFYTVIQGNDEYRKALLMVRVDVTGKTVEVVDDAETSSAKIKPMRLVK